MSGAPLPLVGLATVLAFTGPPIVRAQAYTARQLDCARYHESARSEIETETGGRLTRAVAEREGWWRFRARDTVGGIAIEGWYDSLSIRHGTGDTLTAPDTDGIIGGRYRGLLHPTGAYLRRSVPFVPDELAEVVDASAALDELFPLLPARPLRVGERWSDDAGLKLERRPDSVAAGRALMRYALSRHTERTQAIPRGDTVPVPLDQSTTEEATIMWEPRVGLLRRDRRTVTEASIPAGGRVRAPVRSRLVQDATLLRLASTPCR